MTQRIFTSDDQLAFAKLSGDYNPLHLDPVLARRLIFGHQVVHGVHALLWSLDDHLKSLRATFGTADGQSQFSGRNRRRADNPLLGDPAG